MINIPGAHLNPQKAPAVISRSCCTNDHILHTFCGCQGHRQTSVLLMGLLWDSFLLRCKAEARLLLKAPACPWLDRPVLATLLLALPPHHFWGSYPIVEKIQAFCGGGTAPALPDSIPILCQLNVRSTPTPNITNVPQVGSMERSPQEVSAL